MSGLVIWLQYIFRDTYSPNRYAGSKPTLLVKGDKIALKGQAIIGKWIKHIDFFINEVSKDNDALIAKYEQLKNITNI